MTPTPLPTARPVRTAPPTPTPTPVRDVNRLQVVLPPSGYDTNVPWHGGLTGLLDKRPALEFLIGISRSDGSLQPELATRWEISPDGMSWRLELREGVDFHDGWGEWTARDVVHTAWTVRRDDSKLAEAVLWRSLFGEPGSSSEAGSQFETIGEHEIIIHTVQPAPELDRALSANAVMGQVSKAYWDAAGLNGYGQDTIGTGPYRFVERKSGESVLYERVDAHWRKTPEFRELRISTTADSSRRLASLLAGEAHITELPSDLIGEATEHGLEVVRGGAPALQSTYQWGGLYFATPSRLDTTEPFTDIRVREAMNRAINRRELIDNYLPGKAEITHLFGYHHTLLPGFNSRWAESFDEMYGYDPLRARELLEEAGHAGGFEFTLYTFPYPGLPQMELIGQALEGFFEAIGLQPQVVRPDRPVFTEEYQRKNAYGKMWPMRMDATPVQTMIGHWAYSQTGGYAFEDPRIDETFRRLELATDPVERDRLMRDIGDILYDNYAYLNLFWVFPELVADPHVVSEYSFPGTIAGVATHLEYVVRAAR